MTQPDQALNSATGRELDQLGRFAACLGSTLDVESLVSDTIEPLTSMAQSQEVMIAVAQTDARLLIPVTKGWKLTPSAKGIPAPPIASLGTEAVAFNSMDEIPHQLSSRLVSIPGYIAIVPMWAHAHLRGVIVLLRKQGRFISYMLKLLTTAGRQLALAVENCRLLADLQDSYRKLMNTQEDLIRAERLAALGQLSATMAHEIRNPLATIFSSISQIRKHGATGDLSMTLLDIAEEEASRLNNMVSELLDFARPRKPILEEGNIVETIKKSVEGLKAAEKVPPEVDIVINDSLGELSVMHDSDQISQAITLAVENGIDAMEDEKGKVEIAVKALSEGCLVSISDNGTGIPDEYRAKIFEPFYSTKPTGTGLGLPTVKRVIEDHKGQVEVISKSGEGTEIRLLIQTRI